jgi:hypothetical protein
VKASKSLPNCEVQQEQWLRHFDALSNDDREIIEQETREAKAACGSRLAVAKHLANVRDILCRDLANAKQKRLWTLYLKARLPGLAVSRSQAFRDIKAWETAKENFPAALLDAFLSSGYALSVRPTVEEPLGKNTKPIQRILAKLKSEELNEKQCQIVLADAAAKIKAEAKKNRVHTSALSAQEKRDRILADIHNLVIKRIEELSKAIEDGESYTSMHVRDDLELIVNRLMTGTQTDALELEPKSLPEGFMRLSLPGSAVDSSDETNSETALAATAS